MEPDLGPAADQMARLVAGVRDDQLADPTPCTDYDVAALLDHVVGFVGGLTAAARGEAGAPPPPGDGASLDPAWRSKLPAALAGLAAAWREPGALDRTLEVGGIEMPARAAFLVANEELVIHGWDLATATGQPFSATDADLEVVGSFFERFGPEQRGGGYAPGVDDAGDGSELDRLVATSGRQPGWTAA